MYGDAKRSMYRESVYVHFMGFPLKPTASGGCMSWYLCRKEFDSRVSLLSANESTYLKTKTDRCFFQGKHSGHPYDSFRSPIRRDLCGSHSLFCVSLLEVPRVHNKCDRTLFFRLTWTIGSCDNLHSESLPEFWLHSPADSERSLSG